MCGCLDLAHNPGMCPDWESNQRPFGLQAGAQSTEPHQPGPEFISKASRSPKQQHTGPQGNTARRKLTQKDLTKWLVK